MEQVQKVILIRDIRKNFYVTGISEKYNSIDSGLDMLEHYTVGLDIVTDGGYMATIVGVFLKMSVDEFVNPYSDVDKMVIPEEFASKFCVIEEC